MLKIVTVPNDVLVTPSKSVVSFDAKLHELINDMEKVLNAQVDPQGVGLAAPQVGIGLSIFIMKPTAKSKIMAFINPRILRTETGDLKLDNEVGDLKLEKHQASSLKHQDPASRFKHPASRKKRHFEGCLSIPKIWSPVKRAKKIQLEYQTVNGEKKTEWFSGFEAEIIQHEVDHLKGILFTQRALEQKSQLYEEKKGKLVKMEY